MYWKLPKIGFCRAILDCTILRKFTAMCRTLEPIAIYLQLRALVGTFH